MENIKGALEYALHAFEHLHNTQTYQGDNQDFSDEIITMRQALAELEQSTAVGKVVTVGSCRLPSKVELTPWTFSTLFFFFQAPLSSGLS